MGLFKIGNLIKAKDDAAFSLVPRLPAWSFLRIICGGFPPASPERLAMAGRLAPSALPRNRGLRFPPLISREKDDGLPPGTSEKATSPSKLWRGALDNRLLRIDRRLMQV
jgi:hypothetical protein